MLIERFVPIYDTIERHECSVATSPDRAYRALRELDFSRSAPIAVLLAIRALPRLLMGRERPTGGLTFDRLLKSGFVVLAEEPGEELVLGVIGRFWTLDGGIRRVPADEFIAFGEPGHAKAAWNFRVEPEPSGATRVVTETRVLCTDDAARRRFGWYWRLVGPFSALIRRLMLDLVARAVDAPAGDAVSRAGVS